MPTSGDVASSPLCGRRLPITEAVSWLLGLAVQQARMSPPSRNFLPSPVGINSSYLCATLPLQRTSLRRGLGPKRMRWRERLTDGMSSRPFWEEEVPRKELE